MILDHIKNYTFTNQNKAHECLPCLLLELLYYLKCNYSLTDSSLLTDLSFKEHYYKFGDYSIKYTISDNMTRLAENTFWESHYKYVDIQYILFGRELIGFSQINNLTLLEEYNEQKDLVKYHGELSSVLALTADMFAIFYPTDAHKPLLHAKEEVAQRVVKLLMKVPFKLL